MGFISCTFEDNKVFILKASFSFFMGQFTTIKITTNTAKRLFKLKTVGKSYEEVLITLMDAYQKNGV